MGRSYPTSTMARARELHGAGWLCGQIAEILQRETGVRPHEVTIRRWVDPDYAEAQRQAQRTSAGRTRKWGWRNRRERARELHRAGLSYTDIAKVFALDFGLNLSAEEVEAVVDDSGGSAIAAAILTPQGASA